MTELSQATDHKFKDQEFFFWYLKKGVISKELTKEMDAKDQMLMLPQLNHMRLNGLKQKLIN